MIQHSFFLAVVPKATARSRCVCRGRFPQVYTDPGYKAWLSEVLPKLNLQDPLLEPGQRKLPVRLQVEAVFPRPKTTKLIAPRVDNDNVEKGLWDAMTKAGLWWEDDSQIIENRTTRRWTRDGEEPGYHIKVVFDADA